MRTATPELSVIIPTYNRRQVLAQALAALARQTVPADRYEVIVIDDGSTDGTAEVVAARAHGGLPVRCLRQPNRGANAARNRGIDEARAPLLLFMNDDTIGVPALLDEHLRTHGQHPEENVAVLGRMTIAPELAASIFADLHLDAAFRRFAGQPELHWTAFFTCNISVKRSFLWAHGRFDERMRWHEDIELASRLRAHGLRILYNPEGLGYHLHNLTEADYLGMAEREGRALVTWWRSAPHLRADLAMLGLPPARTLAGRLRYAIADVILNRWACSGLLAAARWLGPRHRGAAQRLYLKLFQAAKRRAIRHEMRRSCPA